MNLAILQHPDKTEIRPQGPRLDAIHVLGFKENMRSAIEHSSGDLILDLKLIDFLDSSGLGALVAMGKLVGSRNLTLTNLSPNVAQVFRLTHMDKVFNIDPPLEWDVA